MRTKRMVQVTRCPFLYTRKSFEEDFVDKQMSLN